MRNNYITDWAAMQEGSGGPLPGMGPRKRANVAVADAARSAGDERTAARLDACGMMPITAIHRDSGETGVVAMQHCHVRLCPVCEWARARANYARLARALDWLEDEGMRYKPLFLTLTARNCRPSAIRAEIAHMGRAWASLSRKRLPSVMRGYWRAIEVTRNAVTGEYHPHMHVLILAPDTYATPAGEYVPHGEWLRQWQAALGVDYNPSVYIERIGGAGAHAVEEHRALLETCKYAAKASDIIVGPDELRAQIWAELSAGIRGVRLVSAGGILRDALRALRLDDLDALDAPEDLSVQARVTASPVDWIILHWRWGASGYVLDRVED